ncbi:hypothetical protein EJ110_NYTH44435 [Nymphaea thermarum]|nr:hypothetical protein EJ110_NYTH44435 [Nymphaea thermarum]
MIFQISTKLPLKMDLVFLSGTVSEISRVEDRVSSLTGAAICWYRWLLSHQGKLDWETLVMEITAHFGPSAYLNYNVELSRIRQTGTHLTTLLHKKDDKFEDKYQICFNLSDKMDLKARTAGKAAISNMLGGIGYFYGQSEIAFSNEHAVRYLFQFLVRTNFSCFMYICSYVCHISRYTHYVD